MEKPSYVELAVEAASIRARLERVQQMAEDAAVDVRAEVRTLRDELDEISVALCRARDQMARELFAALQELDLRV